MESTIGTDSSAAIDDVLARDIKYHLGDRDWYQTHSIAEVCREHSPPDSAFTCLQFDPTEFVAGSVYRRSCVIEPKRIRMRRHLLTTKQRRTVAMINRDLSLMAPGQAYAFELRDARAYDYARIFNTDKPIPVFQYHRRAGFPAIIHPLPQYHEYPSAKLPALRDNIPFAEKRAAIFWRGNLTAWIETPAGPMIVPRLLNDVSMDDDRKLALLRQSLRFLLCEAYADSDFADIGLVLSWKENGHPNRFPLLDRFCRPRCGIEDHFRYRYLLALDGYDGPSSWYWMLNSNSVVFRQESPWQMFGDCYFAPWAHFVPLAPEAGDLEEKFLWCERNLPVCERMVHNARRAWSVLFDPDYQIERRRAVFETYKSWTGV